MSKINDETKEVATRLKQYREDRRYSQLDLATISGVSQNMITYIETGKRVPTLGTLLKLCDALEINPSLLFVPREKEREEARKQVLSFIEQYF